MANVGSAYITLMPSMRGFSGDISKQFGAEGTKAGASFSKGLSGIPSTAAALGKKSAAGFAAAFGVITGVSAAVTSKALGVISSSIGSAVSRVDTLNNFPRVMQSLGYSADESASTISDLSDKLSELPTRLDDMASAIQQLAPSSVSLTQAKDRALAFNDALLAGGTSAGTQQNAMQQLTKVMSTGKMEMDSWMSIQEAMPGQLDQVAKSMLGQSAGAADLYDALKTGRVSVGDFANAIVSLDKRGGAGFDSFYQQAKNATGGIGTSMANLQNAVTKGVANVIQAFGAGSITAPIEALKSVINGAFGAVTNLINAFRNTGGMEAAASILSGLGSIAQQIGDFFVHAVFGVDGFSGAADPAASAGAVLAEVFKRASDAVQLLSENFSWLAPIIGGAVGAFAALKAVMAISSAASGAMSVFGSLAKSTSGIASKAAGAAGGLTQLATGAGKAGAGAGAAAAQILALGGAVALVGVGILAASTGLWMLAQAAIQLAAAGPLAIGVMVGLVAAVALLAIGAALLGPALTAGAAGFIAFGAAVLMVGIGIALASAGFALLATQLPIIATYGVSAAAGIAALALSLVVIAPALLLAGAGALVFGAGALVAGAGTLVFAAAVVTLAAGVVVLAAGMLGASLGLALVAASLPAVAAFSMAAAAGIALLAAATILLAPVLLLAGAGALVFGAGALVGGAGAIVLGAGATLAAAGVTLLAGGVALLAGGMTVLAGAIVAAASGIGVMAGGMPVIASAAPGAAGGLALLAGASIAAAGGLSAGVGPMGTLASACAVTATAVLVASAAFAATTATALVLTKAIMGMPVATKSASASFSLLAKSAADGVAKAEQAVCSGLLRIQAQVSGCQLTLPRIEVGPLPRFSLIGSFDPQSGSAPSVDVSWYAKGAVFGGASVIGVGERGPEAVVPLSSRRMEPFARAVATNMDRPVAADRTDLVDALIEAINRSDLARDLYLDGDVLVGGIERRMTRAQTTRERLARGLA